MYGKNNAEKMNKVRAIVIDKPFMENKSFCGISLSRLMRIKKAPEFPGLSFF